MKINYPFLISATLTVAVGVVFWISFFRFCEWLATV